VVKKQIPRALFRPCSDETHVGSDVLVWTAERKLRLEDSESSCRSARPRLRSLETLGVAKLHSAGSFDFLRTGEGTLPNVGTLE